MGCERRISTGEPAKTGYTGDVAGGVHDDCEYQVSQTLRWSRRAGTIALGEPGAKELINLRITAPEDVHIDGAARRVRPRQLRASLKRGDTDAQQGG